MTLRMTLKNQFKFKRSNNYKLPEGLYRNKENSFKKSNYQTRLGT